MRHLSGADFMRCNLFRCSAAASLVTDSNPLPGEFRRWPAVNTSSALLLLLLLLLVWS